MGLLTTMLLKASMCNAWVMFGGDTQDTFWTVTHQPASTSPYGNFSEPNPALNAAVASLSLAQVAIGDAIGATNRTLVLRTCRQDGLVLRTARPATAIDATFWTASAAPTGDVWSTYSSISAATAQLGQPLLYPNRLEVHYVLAANLSKAWSLPLRSQVLLSAWQPPTSMPPDRYRLTPPPPPLPPPAALWQRSPRTCFVNRTVSWWWTWRVARLPKALSWP